MPILLQSINWRLTLSGRLISAGCAVHLNGLAQAMTSLGVLPGDQQSRAEAISADGSVIVALKPSKQLQLFADTVSLS